jgi:ribosome maturation factor RimP
MTAGTSQRDRLAALIEPVVAKAGYDLEEVVVTPAGRRRLVRVVVDADSGVSLDDVAEVSRAISTALDEHDAAAGGVVGSAPYVLEVSSPGVDRPLREPRHWRRAVGRLVQVPVTGQPAVTGRVLRADDAGVLLAVGDTERGYRYEELGNGRVQVEFRREEGDA